MTENSFMQTKVEDYCKTQGVKKKDFAAMIDVSPVMLSHWLKGRVRFKFSTLEKINQIIEN